MGEILDFETYAKNAEAAASEETEFEPSDELMKTQEDFLSRLYALGLPSADTDEISNLNKQGVMQAYFDGFANGCEGARVDTEIAIEERARQEACHAVLGSPAFRELYDRVAAAHPELFDGIDIDDLSEVAVKLLREKAAEAVKVSTAASKESQRALFEAVVRHAIGTMSTDDDGATDALGEGLDAMAASVDELTEEVMRAAPDVATIEKIGAMVDSILFDALEHWAALGCRRGYEAGLRVGRAEKGAA